MIGVDLVVVSRIQSMIDRFGQKALSRFLNDDEIKLVKKTATAAGFWAAKEAASKAIGTGIGSKCGFHDIKITKNKNGVPKLKYKKDIRKRYKIKNSALSITHDGNYAIAVVVNELKK